jgi:hypothetical protein
MLFKETVAVYRENYTNPIKTLHGQNADLLIVKAGGTFGYHEVIKC